MATVSVRTRPRLILSGCPKCTGDLYRDDRSYHCLQCGYVKWDYQLKHLDNDKIKMEGRHNE